MFPTEDQLKPIFHLRFGSTVNQVGDFAPLVANLQPFLEKVEIVPQSPLTFIDGGIERSEPSLSALFAITLSVSKLLSLIHLL